MLQIRYVANIVWKEKFIQTKSQIIIQILKSPHHKAIPPENKICKKKNIKIQRAQIVQLKKGLFQKNDSGKNIL